MRCQLPELDLVLDTLERAKRLHMVSVYDIPWPLQTPEQPLIGGILPAGSKFIAEKVKAKLADQEPVLNISSHLVVGHSALVRAGINLPALQHVRHTLALDHQRGDDSIGILPLSEDAPALPSNWPAERFVSHEWDTILLELQTPTEGADGYASFIIDGLVQIPTDTAAGREATANRIEVVKQVGLQAVYGEDALALVDEALGYNGYTPSN